MSAALGEDCAIRLLLVFTDPESLNYPNQDERLPVF